LFDHKSGQLNKRKLQQGKAMAIFQQLKTVVRKNGEGDVFLCSFSGIRKKVITA